MVSMPVELYTDGSSLGNPGPAGLGYIIRYYEDVEGAKDEMPKESIIEGKQGFKFSTNNRMEIMAVIYGFDEIVRNIQNGKLQGVSQINVLSDSEYFVKAMNQNWVGKWQSNNWITSGFKGRKPGKVKNRDLWEELLQVHTQVRLMGVNITFTHVEGHSGDEFNDKADALAVSASNCKNKDKMIVDEGYSRGKL